MTTRDVVIGVAALLLGWSAHVFWSEVVVPWWYDATGIVLGVVHDLFAIAGVVAACYVGYLVAT